MMVAAGSFTTWAFAVFAEIIHTQAIVNTLAVNGNLAPLTPATNQGSWAGCKTEAATGEFINKDPSVDKLVSKVSLTN
jgi:hypothetical protein